jgi:hypothetical protein
MGEFEYIRKDDGWQAFCQRYLKRNSFCSACEDNGKATYATIVYQPTPEADKNKKYREYNLKPLCYECYSQIRIKETLKVILKKVAVLAGVLFALALLIKWFL